MKSLRSFVIVFLVASCASVLMAQSITPSWFANACGGTSSDTQVLFNDASVCRGDAGLTYNKTTDTLTVVGSVVLGATPAGAGAVRLTNNTALNWRNAANTADVGWTLTNGDRMSLTSTKALEVGMLFLEGSDVAFDRTTTTAARLNAPLQLGGIAGNGTLYGSAAANGDLTLEGTSHATKATSYVTLQSTGGLVGIGLTTPTALLHLNEATLGNSVVTVATTATNDDPTVNIQQNRVATTDATVTTLHTIAMPASTTVAADCAITARRTGGIAGTAEDGARYRLELVYKNVAGTATEIGEVLTVIGESQAAWTATATPSAANALVQVTGAADNNITWHASCALSPVGS